MLGGLGDRAQRAPDDRIGRLEARLEEQSRQIADLRKFGAALIDHIAALEERRASLPRGAGDIVADADGRPIFRHAQEIARLKALL